MTSKATTEDVQDVTPTEAQAPAPEENKGLSLNDIGACVSIIDIVTKRGAFEGSELADVGAVRNRLSVFLEAAKASQEVPAETETTTE